MKFNLSPRSQPVINKRRDNIEHGWQSEGENPWCRQSEIDCARAAVQMSDIHGLCPGHVCALPRVLFSFAYFVFVSSVLLTCSIIRRSKCTFQLQSLRPYPPNLYLILFHSVIISISTTVPLLHNSPVSSAIISMYLLLLHYFHSFHVKRK
jgi:hypothetical protein